MYIFSIKSKSKYVKRKRISISLKLNFGDPWEGLTISRDTLFSQSDNDSI